MSLRPHDLLRLSTPVARAAGPDWVAAALADAPWVVVRRATAGPGLIPVGVRGPTRADRFAFGLNPAAVAGIVRPEDLADPETTPAATPAAPAPPPIPSAPDRLSVLVALERARDVLAATGWVWGPTGSVGFQLATGRPTVTPDSDLDLVVRVPALPPREELRRLHEHLPTRADCLIETPGGALALAELASGSRQALLRTAAGPRLVSV